MTIIRCLGVSSKVGRKHAFFLDLDKTSMITIKSIIKDLFWRYGLSDIYLIKSSPGNYHIITLDKMYFKDAIRIASEYADPEWIKFRKKSKEFILRVSPKCANSKPELIAVKYAPTFKHIKSNAHRLLLNQIYNIGIKKTREFDNNSRLILDYYATIYKGNV